MLLLLLPAALVVLLGAGYVVAVLNADLSQEYRVVLLSAGLAGIVGLATASGGWVSTSLREREQHAHERAMAVGSRVYERRAPAYERLLTHLNNYYATLAKTLPLMSYGGDSQDPLADLSDADASRWREEASLERRGLDVVVTAYASEAVANLVKELGSVEVRFWDNVAEYRSEGGSEARDRIRFYREATEARSVYAGIMARIREQVRTELASGL